MQLVLLICLLYVPPPPPQPPQQTKKDVNGNVDPKFTNICLHLSRMVMWGELGEGGEWGGVLLHACT